jgi:hypothetical protein
MTMPDVLGWIIGLAVIAAALGCLAIAGLFAAWAWRVLIDDIRRHGRWPRA